MTALFVLLWLFAVMGVACVVQRIIDAFRRSSRVVKAVPSVIEPTPLRFLGSSALACFVYHSASVIMYSMPVRTVCTFFTSPEMT